MDSIKPFRKYGCIQLLVAYFIYAALFPSLRLLLLGSDASSGFWEILFSMTPDLLLIFSFALCVFQAGEFFRWQNLNIADKAFALYLAVSLLWGFFSFTGSVIVGAVCKVDLPAMHRLFYRTRHFPGRVDEELVEGFRNYFCHPVFFMPGRTRPVLLLSGRRFLHDAEGKLFSE